MQPDPLNESLPPTNSEDTESAGMSGFSRISSIDDQLIALLAQRADLCRDLPLEKLNSIGSQLVQRTSSPSLEGLLATDLQNDWLQHAHSLCMRVVESTRAPIVYLGPIYSYSYLAAVKHFGLGAELVPVSTIAAVFDELVRGQATFGVVPIENNTDCRVVDTLGMFARTPIDICGEVLLPIHHCLLGLGHRNDIEEIYSKPQALSQCRNWLAQHLPEARLVEVSSTALAAARASQNAAIAAIQRSWYSPWPADY